MITPEQYEQLKPIKRIYDEFKRIGEVYISAENVGLIKRTAADFGYKVSQECTSCAPELLIQLIRHQYMPYEEEMRKEPVPHTKPARTRNTNK